MKAQKRVFAADDTPIEEVWPHWGAALFVACAGSWCALIGAVKLMISLF